MSAEGDTACGVDDLQAPAQQNWMWAGDDVAFDEWVDDVGLGLVDYVCFPLVVGSQLLGMAEVWEGSANTIVLL